MLSDDPGLRLAFRIGQLAGHVSGFTWLMRQYVAAALCRAAIGIAHAAPPLVLRGRVFSRVALAGMRLANALLDVAIAVKPRR
jgi:hypothetical protein